MDFEKIKPGATMNFRVAKRDEDNINTLLTRLRRYRDVDGGIEGMDTMDLIALIWCERISTRIPNKCKPQTREERALARAIEENLDKILRMDGVNGRRGDGKWRYHREMIDALKDVLVQLYFATLDEPTLRRATRVSGVREPEPQEQRPEPIGPAPSYEELKRRGIL